MATFKKYEVEHEVNGYELYVTFCKYIGNDVNQHDDIVNVYCYVDGQEVALFEEGPCFGCGNIDEFLKDMINDFEKYAYVCSEIDQ